MCSSLKFKLQAKLELKIKLLWTWIARKASLLALCGHVTPAESSDWIVYLPFPPISSNSRSLLPRGSEEWQYALLILQQIATLRVSARLLSTSWESPWRSGVLVLEIRKREFHFAGILLYECFLHEYSFQGKKNFENPFTNTKVMAVYSKGSKNLSKID